MVRHECAPPPIHKPLGKYKEIHGPHKLNGGLFRYGMVTKLTKQISGALCGANVNFIELIQVKSLKSISSSRNRDRRGGE